MCELKFDGNIPVGRWFSVDENQLHYFFFHILSYIAMATSTALDITQKADNLQTKSDALSLLPANLVDFTLGIQLLKEGNGEEALGVIT